MRRFLKFCLLHSAFCISIAHGTVSTDIPAAFPAERYEPLIKSLPFTLATPVAAVAAPGFASNLYLTGLAKIGDRDFVTVAYRDQQSRFSLFSGEQNPDGIAIVSVEWSEVAGKSKVTVKKGAEFGTLTFDEQTIQRPVQVTPQVQQPPQMPQVGQPMQRQVVLPRTNPLAPPGAPSQIAQPRMPVIVPPPGNQTRQGAASRSRSAIINSKP